MKERDGRPVDACGVDPSFTPPHLLHSATIIAPELTAAISHNRVSAVNRP